MNICFQKKLFKLTLGEYSLSTQGIKNKLRHVLEPGKHIVTNGNAALKKAAHSNLQSTALSTYTLLPHFGGYQHSDAISGSLG